MLHGFMMGVFSCAGGYAINNYGQELGRVGKIASSAVLGGVVSEIGGGKFANGAITAAYSMMFNEFMHEQYTKRANSQLSLLFDGEKVYVMDKEGNKIYSTTATSGKGEHMNNPSSQNVENLGPIPQGIYSYNNSKWKTMTKWQQCEYRTSPVHISNSGKFYTKKSVRWGSNKYYRNKKIGSHTLRKWNGQLRNTKLPGNNWRVNDPGHLHLKK